MKYLFTTGLLVMLLVGGGRLAAVASKLQHASKTDSVMDEYNSVFFKEGLNGLEKTVAKCYEKAARKHNNVKLSNKCVMLDMLSYYNRKQMLDIGMRVDSNYLEYRETEKRVKKLLTQTGMTKRNEQEAYINTMLKSAETLASE